VAALTTTKIVTLTSLRESTFVEKSISSEYSILVSRALGVAVATRALVSSELPLFSSYF
jgi:hypothetical protein